MSRLLPYPLLSAGLVVMWLLLNHLSLGHLVLGSAIAIVAGQAMSALEPDKPRVRSWSAVLRLIGRITVDIVRSNIAVARLLLFGRRPGGRPGFIDIPLVLRDPTALAILAVALTATPGTAWIEHDAATGNLLLHVLDLHDDDDWYEIVKTRYESLLMEIFE